MLYLWEKRKFTHSSHLIYTDNKEDFFNPKYWRVLCATCHAKTPNKFKKMGYLKNPNVIEKDSPYKIICDCCKKPFLSLNPYRKFCNFCHKFWAGNWGIYKVLTYKERMFFISKGGLHKAFDTIEESKAFYNMVEKRKLINIQKAVKKVR